MKSWFFLFITTAAIGCTTPGHSQKNNNLFTNLKSIKASTIRIDIDRDFIIEPIYSTAIKSKLLSGSFLTDPMVDIYNLQTNHQEHGIQSKGKGPYEMLRLASMYTHNSLLFLYSSQEGKIFWRHINDSSAKPTRTLYADARKRDLFWFKMAPVAGNRYIVTGIMDPTTKSQFALLDSTLRVTRYFDSFPVEGTPMANLSFPQQSMGFQGWMTITPDGKRMMWTSKPGSIFRFYDLSYQRPLKIKEYILNIPVFHARTDTDTGVEQDRDNEWGVLNATANDSCFFALYSSKRIAERSLESIDIYVFDLRGNPVKHLVLDRPATHIVWVPGEGGEEDHIRGLYMFGRNEKSLEPEIFKVVY